MLGNWPHLPGYLARFIGRAALFLFLINQLNGVLWAQTPQNNLIRPAVSDPTWQATYWNNPTLSGAPALQRSDAQLDFIWGNGAPAPALNPDRFSARWTRYLYLEAGVYRFSATSDDGVRVYINDQRIIDGWSDHSEQTFTANVQVNAGHHLVRVEYYESSGLATMRLNWAAVGNDQPAPSNWRAEFFNNRDLVGSPVVVRDDREVNFDWGVGAPTSGISVDNFSARWTRTLDLPAGNYRFRITVDDGARLWVNNALIIDSWREQSATTYTSDIYLPKGVIPLRLEYFDLSGGAVIRLTWERTDQPPAPTARWRGEYFNNRALSGTAVVVREENQIDFDWGIGSPASGIGADNFSARWLRTVDLPAGVYRFRVRVDDGVRLWIGNSLLIDQWRSQEDSTYMAELKLPGGPVPIRLEYFELDGAARLKLWWERADQAPGSTPTSTPVPVPTPTPVTPTLGKRWHGEYFANRELRGAPVLTREEQAIDFSWGSSSPAPDQVPDDNFSARWTITLDFSGGLYRFTTETDDGVRLYIDNKLVIDQWREMSTTRASREVQLSRGVHTLRMEYFEQSGYALARLGWRKLANATARVGVPL